MKEIELPKDLRMEQLVIGCMVLDRNAMINCMPVLSEKSFYDAKNLEVFKTLKAIFGRGEEVDIVSISRELKKNKSTLKAYDVSQYTTTITAKWDAFKYALELVECQIRREAIINAMKTIQMAQDESVEIFDMIESTEKLSADINNQISGAKDAVHISEAIAESDKHLEACRNKGGITGVPTGFSDFDEVTTGLKGGELIIVAARPGMGKTAFSLQLARNVAVAGVPMVFFSMEMPRLQLTNRLQASEAEIPMDVFKTAMITDAMMVDKNNKVGKLAKSELYIDDTASMNVMQLKAKSRVLKYKHKIGLIVVDYLQLMSSVERKGNREQEISNISRELKLLAKELNIPIIALSQLSRSVETRGGDKRPMLSDLRESGAIEQDADMVCFLYRPEYYDIDKNKEGIIYPKHYAEVIIAKHRNGSLGEVPLKFLGQFQKFLNVKEYEKTEDAPF